MDGWMPCWFDFRKCRRPVVYTTHAKHKCKGIKGSKTHTGLLTVTLQYVYSTVSAELANTVKHKASRYCIPGDGGDQNLSWNELKYWTLLGGVQYKCDIGPWTDRSRSVAACLFLWSYSERSSGGLSLYEVQGQKKKRKGHHRGTESQDIQYS